MNYKKFYKLENSDSQGGIRTKNKKSFSVKANEPLISVITAVLNGEKYLEECICSLYQQNFDNYEHLIIDGGSVDKTIDILKKYENKIEYWCSKNDNGIYDAFNKGMMLAKGKYICFLNSDDIFYPEAFEIVTNYIKRYPEKDFIFASVKKHWGILHGYKPYKINWSWGFYSSHSTGFFIKNSSAQKVGLYNLKYKYSSDYDYFYRMIKKLKLKGIATKKNEVVGNFRRGGFSSSIPFIDHFFEEIKIRIDNGQNKLLILIIIIYKFIKNFKKI
jgi:glycosyltransferase involved in cell wall biosynthesis